jgi:murein L,D-transpeptidase YcbB/YkuD
MKIFSGTSMRFGGSGLYSSSLTAVASALIALAPSLARGQNAPIDASRDRPLSPIVQQLDHISTPMENELFPLDDAPASVVLTGAREPLTSTDSFDVAEAPLTDGQRLLASALDNWVKAPISRADAAERRRQRAAIAAVYAARAYQPLWRDGAPDDAAWLPAATSAAERLRYASEDGLDLRGYILPAVDQGASNIEDELALSEAVVAYAAQAAGSRVDPQRISRLIGARPRLPNTEAVLINVAAGGAEAGDILEAYNPPHYGYQLLKAKLAELRAGRAMDDRSAVRLALADSARDDGPSAAGRTRRRSAKRARFSSSHLEAEVIANMERWRWLPRDLGESRIEVNIPEFELAVIRDGAVTHRARIIVGKEKTPTPVFSNAVQFIIVNPYWNVPPSILNKEMLPQSGGDVLALEQRGFQVSYHHGKLRVRQPPGERNALGRIKFMFPNDFSVYLHDTPSRHLFSASHRAFSHGCMRVDQPFALAEVVLGPGSGWSEKRVRRLVGGSERYINLSKPLPIHIEYFTAYVDEDGQLQLRDDLYGYSARVRRELGLGG